MRPSRVVGIDMSEQKFSHARAKAAGRNVTLKQMDAQNLPFDDDSFDTLMQGLPLETRYEGKGFWPTSSACRTPVRH